ncbi:DUF5367 family protein [Paenibacillus sp. GYB003]|uniref:DUF5367 family protein n=1 Tax=Paenibacillus sp. GYB003 TaxID=2994392 RepID=UPI002F96A910
MNAMPAYKRREPFFLLWGFLLWLAATVVFHLFGDWLIDADNRVKTAVSFLAAVPVICGCTFPLYFKFHIPPADRLRLAVCIALPGMLLDIVSVPLHRIVFPAISGESVPLLAAWLLWAYSLVLATGLFSWKR